jgi:hypothetical protein
MPPPAVVRNSRHIGAQLSTMQANLVSDRIVTSAWRMLIPLGGRREGVAVAHGLAPRTGGFAKQIGFGGGRRMG